MSLPQIRQQIDKIDAQLLELLNARARLAEEIGRIKRAAGQAVLAPDREEVLLRGLVKKNTGPLDAAAVRAIFREILSSCRARQKNLRIGYFGSEGSYCHQAATSRFGSGETYHGSPTIPEVFALLEREEVDAAVVPVENSIEGGVNATYDMLVNTSAVICGEVYLRIRHVLAAPARAKRIESIYSHPQALGQCRQWLLQNFPQARQIEASSTTHGAQLARTQPHAAAICSPFAARAAGLKILHADIQDVPRNFTRFIILSRQIPAASGQDKTSLLFSVSHEVGALGKILNIFSNYGINLEKIESRPAMRKEWEYHFFVDVRGHAHTDGLKKALEDVRSKTLWLKILGSYPQAPRDV